MICRITKYYVDNFVGIVVSHGLERIKMLLNNQFCRYVWCFYKISDPVKFLATNTWN